MASLKEIAYNIKSIANNGNPSDDDNLSLRQIYHWIHIHRAAILKEYSKNGQKINLAYYQVISFDLSIDGSLHTRDLDFDIISLDGVSTLKRAYLYTLGSLQELSIITRAGVKSYKSNKFTSSKPYCYIHHGDSEYLGTSIASYGRKITVGGYSGIWSGFRLTCILSNPEDGFNLGGGGAAGTDSGTFDYDAEYPFPQELVPLLVKSVVETELHISMSTQEDKINDGDDATLMRSKRAK